MSNIPLRDPERVLFRRLYLDGSIGPIAGETLRALAGLFDWGLIVATWVNDYGPVRYSFTLTPKGEELAQELFAPRPEDIKIDLGTDDYRDVTPEQIAEGRAKLQAAIDEARKVMRVQVCVTPWPGEKLD